MLTNVTIGTYWHQLLDTYFKGNLSTDELAKIYACIFDKQLFDQIKVFVLDYIVAGYIVIESEVSLQFNIADLVLTNLKTNHKIIIDWKYSDKPILEIIKNNKEQLQRYLEETNCSIVLYSIKTGDHLQVFSTKQQAEETIKTIYDYANNKEESVVTVWNSNKKSKMFKYNGYSMDKVYKELIREQQSDGENRNYLTWIRNKKNWQNNNFTQQVSQSINGLYDYVQQLENKQ